MSCASLLVLKSGNILWQVITKLESFWRPKNEIRG